MQRRLEIVIPLVLFALMVQLFAPVAAFRAFASAVTDPLYMAMNCADMSAADHRDDPSNKQQHHADCCAFCAASHGGAFAIDTPAPVFVSLQRQYQLISWLEAAYPTPSLRVDSNAQARAPPSIS